MEGYIVEDPENYFRDVSGADLRYEVEFLEGEIVTFDKDLADEAEACFLEVITCEVDDNGEGYVKY